MRRDAQRLEDVIEAIERIEKYSVAGRKEFDNNELVQVWCVHHIQIIGEAMANISDEVHNRYPEFAWSQIIAMRNILVHAYFGVDHDAVWNVIENHLPDLKSNAQTMLQTLSTGTDNDAWFARIKELPGCMTEVDTWEEVLPVIEEAKYLWLELALERGRPIPEPQGIQVEER